MWYVYLYIAPSVWQVYIYFRKLRVGDPTNADNFIGALISKEHLAKVKGYVVMAGQEGASILCGDEDLTSELPEKYKQVSYTYNTFCQITAIRKHHK